MLDFLKKKDRIGENRARWLVQDNFDSSWGPRAKTIAGLIPSDTKTVCDIGCGMQHLRKVLPPHFRYLPADLKQWTEDTQLCDINAGVLPENCILASDCCTSIGLIEYIVDPQPLFSFIGKSGKKFITTYNTTENSPNRNPIWVSAFTSSDILSFARKADLELVSTLYTIDTSMIFVFHPR